MMREYRNDRGVALLIVLLVTTLLTALVFEFTYGTRVSLRAAANYRDSVRAYFLARSGINFAGRLLAELKKNNQLQDQLEQRDWYPVPFVSEEDSILRVRWEDEAGKIRVNDARSNQYVHKRLELLFGIRGVSLNALDRMTDPASELNKIALVSELHRFLSDEEYTKLCGAEYGSPCNSVTVFGTNQIDINTASEDVLQSMGLQPVTTAAIKEHRENEPFDSHQKVAAFPGVDTMTAGMLDITSDVFFVQSSATVGGYTKQADAVIKRSAGGFTILYWRIL